MNLLPDEKQKPDEAENLEVPYSDPVKESEYQGLNEEQQELKRVAHEAIKGKRVLSRFSGKDSSSQKWLRYSGIGIQMGVMIAFPALGGRWLDERFGMEPFGVVFGVLFGFAAGLYSVISFVNRTEAKEKKSGTAENDADQSK